MARQTSVRRRTPWGIGALALILATGALIPDWAAAQDGFLFREPHVSLTARVGYATPVGSDPLMDFTSGQLTLERSDFGAPALGGELGVSVSSRLDLTLSAGWTGRTVHSEFRDWVGQDDLPIEQSTEFHRWYVVAGARLYLLPRGRSVGSFAWVPAGVAPYLGAQVGQASYSWVQDGEWVDFQTLDIFKERFSSRGDAVTAMGSAGMDVSLSNRWYLNTEARYGWARAGLSSDFVDFGKLNLSGLQLAAGVGVRL